jgi:hypothetical protein
LAFRLEHQDAISLDGLVGGDRRGGMGKDQAEAGCE